MLYYYLKIIMLCYTLKPSLDKKEERQNLVRVLKGNIQIDKDYKLFKIHRSFLAFCIQVFSLSHRKVVI